MDRRRFLRGSIAAVGAGVLASDRPGVAADVPVGGDRRKPAGGDGEQQPAPSTRSGEPKAPTRGDEKLTVYAFESNIWVRINEEPFTCYRAGQGQKYPYFFPVLGPATGASMTEESGEQFPHHRSLFLGCDRVNGANFWQEGLDRGQIVSRRPQVESTADKVVIADRCDWKVPGASPVIEDDRRYLIRIPRTGWRELDAEVRLTALTDVHIAQTNHSLFSIRAARTITPASGGVLVNSAGQSGGKGTFGQKAAWCCFSGTRLGRAETIVLMDHPRNPWSPCPWFTRDYGFMSPTPFFWMEDGWRLPKDKSVVLRYRVLVMASGVDAGEITKRYEAFAAEG